MFDTVPDNWLSFREARGGPIAFFSDEGTRIELDERAILTRLYEDLERTGHVPLAESLTKLATWLTEAAAKDRMIGATEELSTAPEGALARAALLSHTVLNSTLCILQPRPQTR